MNTTNNYRVTRSTSGIDWGKRRYSYHRTYNQAFAAARSFMNGEGYFHYALGKWSVATVEARHPSMGWWSETNRWAGTRPVAIIDGEVTEVEVRVKVPVRGKPGRYSVSWHEIEVIRPEAKPGDLLYVPEAVEMALRTVERRLQP